MFPSHTSESRRGRRRPIEIIFESNDILHVFTVITVQVLPATAY